MKMTAIIATVRQCECVRSSEILEHLDVILMHVMHAKSAPQLGAPQTFRTFSYQSNVEHRRKVGRVLFAATFVLR